jgi:hypothetical protein
LLELWSSGGPIGAIRLIVPMEDIFLSEYEPDVEAIETTERKEIVTV